MQILEIYIHTIHIHSYTYIYNFFHHHHHPHHPHHRGEGGYWYIHIHTYTTSSTTTTTHHHPHHPHHRGEGGTPPPTTTPPTTTHTTHTTGGRGGTGALLYRPITMGWGGGGYLAMLAHIYTALRIHLYLHIEKPYKAICFNDCYIISKVYISTYTISQLPHPKIRVVPPILSSQTIANCEWATTTSRSKSLSAVAGQNVTVVVTLDISYTWPLWSNCQIDYYLNPFLNCVNS